MTENPIQHTIFLPKESPTFHANHFVIEWLFDAEPAKKIRGQELNRSAQRYSPLPSLEHKTIGY